MHLDVPRPAIGANVQGSPSHDDHVAALIHFRPHGDAVSASAQTMSEDGKEDFNQAHDLLMRQRDSRIAAAARKVEEKRQAEKAEARRAREAEAERRRLRILAERTRREEHEEAERNERRRQQRTSPLGLIDDRGQHLSEAAFKDSAAKWAKMKRAQDCHECGRGYIGGEECYLFMCDVCDKCYHKRCTLWVKVVHRDADPRSDDYSFGCNRCAKTLPPV